MFIGLGTPSVGGLDLPHRIDWIQTHAFEQVELYCCPYPRHLAGIWLRNMDPARRAELAARLRAFPKVDFHAPFQNTFDVSLVTANPLIRRLTVEEITLIIDFAGELGTPDPVITCHSGWPTFGATPEETEQWLIESLTKLSRRASDAGVRIGMEVADFFMPADKCELLAELDLPAVGITLDTGHISFTESNIPMYERYGSIGAFIRHFASRLFHVHIHDYDGKQDHLPIGRGEIDFEDVVAALRDIDYNGAVSLELNSAHVGHAQILESRHRIQCLLRDARRT